MVIQRTQEDQELVKKIGQNIKQLRTSNRYSQQELADATGYKRSDSIHLLESGRVSGFDIVILLRIARFFNVELEELLK
jgi:transcriptional regulator with XRE-family HTH domain